MTTAVDLSHHLSDLSSARKVSPLKSLGKYRASPSPGLVDLAGGYPDPVYFPFASLTAEALVPSSLRQPQEPSLLRWVRSLLSFRPASSPTEETTTFSVPKYPIHPGDINLATALQYGNSTGIQQLKDFLNVFTWKVHQPAYSDWMALVDTGNTDGINRAISTLCNPGEQFLVEEWAYPSTLCGARPMGVYPVPVKVDGGGLSSDDLERVLSEWDESKRGAKRPHVLYTVPIGQNPTGSTMGLARKKAIYEICVKYDIIIIEDDPYFFLQEGTWVPKPERERAAAPIPDFEGSEGDPEMCGALSHDKVTRFIQSLTPSFVRIDYQGRVIRLDSFSKIIAPGSRLGWITANPLFIERLERQAETSTQAPCGFSQGLIAQLLTKHWKLPHFVTWLQDLQAQYTARRDFFVDTIFAAFDVRPGDDAAFGGGAAVYTAHAKRGSGKWLNEKGGQPLFSFVPPSSGMFVWLKFHLRDPTPGAAEPLETRLWTELADNGLLIVPGWWFSPENQPEGGETAHFRLSFSQGSEDVMRRGVGILAKVLEKYV